MYYHNNYRQSNKIIVAQAGSGKITTSGFRDRADVSAFKKSGFLMLICLSGVTFSFSQSLTPAFINVAYAGTNNVKQQMDIYIPPGLTSPAPVIVFIHGGGWSSGSKGPENIPFFQQSYNSGFICADINYRLSTDSVWPAQIEDCKTAIRFLKSNALTYNIDICRFGVIGESAGGHLAAMLGTSAGVKTLEGLHLGYTSQNSRVKAVVDLYGPIDFLKEDGHYPAICGTNRLIHEYQSFETNLLGIDYLHNYPVIVKEANPATYITSDDARFFIIHGEEDCTVPAYQSIILDSALTAAGIKADTLIIVAGQNHGNPYFKDLVRTTLYNDFFLKHLSTPCSANGISETIYKKVLVYPNPASSEIRIDFPLTNNFKIEIINNFGITVFKIQNQNTINISELKSGIYFLKLISIDEIYMQSIIKL